MIVVGQAGGKTERIGGGRRLEATGAPPAAGAPDPASNGACLPPPAYACRRTDLLRGAAMKISAITTTPLALAFKEPYHWAGRVDYGAAVVLVEEQTDEGVGGVG
jgi:hypothetical protein